jgi:hypothetical protein
MTKPAPGEGNEEAQALADSALAEMAAKESDEELEAEVEAHSADKVLWSVSYRT